MSMLLKSLRRVCAKYEGASEFYEANFRRDGIADTRLSVYELPSRQRVQAHAEHAATFTDPPGGAGVGGIDLGPAIGGAPVAATPGTTAFQFTQRAHREVQFFAPEDVERAARKAFLSREVHKCDTPLADICEYAASRVEMGCVEWGALLAQPNRAPWAKKIQAAVIARSRRQAPQS